MPQTPGELCNLKPLAPPPPLPPMVPSQDSNHWSPLPLTWRTWYMWNIELNQAKKYLHGVITVPSSSVSPLLYYNRLTSSSPGTVSMITGRESFFLATCLFEGLLFGKISVLCALAKSWTLQVAKNSLVRTLFRNIHHISTMPIEQVQVNKDHFLCSPSSLCSICSDPCQWCSSSHTFSK